MEKYRLPIPFARAVMRLMPAAALSRSVGILMRKMERRHAGLFRNLERLDKAVIHIEPTDLPHVFELVVGTRPISLSVINGRSRKPSAVMRGRLQVLIDMLEGQIDGDMVFFSREFSITGNTSVVVGLRNTLDRENINLVDDIGSIFGPFAEPMKKALFVLDEVASHIAGGFCEYNSSEKPASKYRRAGADKP